MDANTSLTVLVYVDNGVGERARLVVPATIKKALGPRWTVAAVDAAGIKAGALRDATALIIPGGADLPYCQALNGNGCQQIRSFVANGGIYIGFCAGAYFAAKEIEWNRGEADEIIAPRELAFFQGVAAGPVFGPGTYDPFSEKGARVVPVTTKNGDVAWSYFNGGCSFIGSSPEVDVLARYKEISGTPPAVISLRYKEGTIVLSGVHPEYSSSDLTPNHPLYGELRIVETSREALLQLILQPLFLCELQ
jgi:biotin--protein ligase